MDFSIHSDHFISPSSLSIVLYFVLGSQPTKLSLSLPPSKGLGLMIWTIPACEKPIPEQTPCPGLELLRADPKHQVRGTSLGCKLLPVS